MKLDIPGELPHRPPAVESQQRIPAFSPYVREAKETMRPAWSIKPRKLFDYLLIHWIDGAGELSIGRKKYVAKNGDLFWIPPDTLHEMRGEAPGTLLHYIHFDLNYDPQRSHWSANIPGGTTDLSAWPDRMHPRINDPVIGTWCGRIETGSPALIREPLRRIILNITGRRSRTCLFPGWSANCSVTCSTATTQNHHAATGTRGRLKIPCRKSSCTATKN